MSDISLHEMEINEEELKAMPSETATDEDIPDQTPIADFGDDDVDC